MRMDAGYEIDFVNKKIVVSKAFLKAAGVFGTAQYTQILTLRREHPDFELVKREISRKKDKQTYRNLSYENMRGYIIEKEGKDNPVLTEFDKVLALSKIQSGPYAYVKNWFLGKYRDEFKKDNPQTTETETPASQEADA